MLRPLFLKAAGRSMALTNQPCNRLARKRSENVSGSPMSSTKLSSHSSRNAKLRRNWKTKLSSFRRRSKGSGRRIADSSFINAVSFSFARRPKRFPSQRCASATQIVRRRNQSLRQPKLQPALLRLSRWENLFIWPSPARK